MVQAAGGGGEGEGMRRAGDSDGEGQGDGEGDGGGAGDGDGEGRGGGGCEQNSRLLVWQQPVRGLQERPPTLEAGVVALMILPPSFRSRAMDAQTF